MTPDALAILHAQCFTTPRPWTAAEFTEFLASPLCFLITPPNVLQTDGAAQMGPQGFLLGRVVADEAELLTIAVAPNARRQGTARALMTAFAHQAQARGAATAFLEVASTNNGARALYTATGWQLAGRRRGYYHGPDGQAIDAEVMRRPLGTS